MTVRNIALALAAPALPSAARGADEKITHGFLATGAETYIVDGAGKRTWSYPANTRDGWVLPNGNVLLALSKSKDVPRRRSRRGDERGQDGVRVQGNAGRGEYRAAAWKAATCSSPRPATSRASSKWTRRGRSSSISPSRRRRRTTTCKRGWPASCRTATTSSRNCSTRWCASTTPEGKVVWEVKTPNMPFTAIRLTDGNTLIGCTWGNLVIEVDKDGKEVWRMTNDDLPGKPLNDACGVPAAAERQHGHHQPPHGREQDEADRGDPREEGRVDVHGRGQVRHPPLPDPRHRRQAAGKHHDAVSAKHQ